MSAPEELVVLARIGRPHGVRGALSVDHAGEHLRHFVGQKTALCETIAGAVLGHFKIKANLTLTRVEPAKGQPARVAFAEINDRDAAASLTQASICAPLADLRKLVASDRKKNILPLADLWYFELINLTVVDAASQTVIGTVATVEDMGLNTIITVVPATGQTLLSAPLEIPLAYPHWGEVDLSTRRAELDEWRIFAEA